MTEAGWHVGLVALLLPNRQRQNSTRNTADVWWWWSTPLDVFLDPQTHSLLTQASSLMPISNTGVQQLHFSDLSRFFIKMLVSCMHVGMKVGPKPHSHWMLVMCLAETWLTLRFQCRIILQTVMFVKTLLSVAEKWMFLHIHSCLKKYLLVWLWQLQCWL